MNEFKNYHPIVNLLYFAAVITFSMFIMQPVCLAISLVCGFTYSVMLGKKKTLKSHVLYLLPLILAMALINPAFNHEGVTILSYFPNGNPLTLESIVYGVAAATMIAGILCHFSCFNQIMTSDKLIYLFGKITPAFSLILSMIFRFVPRFKAQTETVRNAQKCFGRDSSDGSIFQRMKNGLKILSVMITWSLENAIDTADSMRSRGYGLPNRTAFSNFRFDRRDGWTMLLLAVLTVYVLIGKISHALRFQYFPSLKGAALTPYNISLIAAYAFLCGMPILIEIKEALRWKKLKSKL